MKRQHTEHLLRKLILQPARRSRLISAWFALWLGICLLLISVTVWWNFRQILHGAEGGDSLGSTFVTISKPVSAGQTDFSEWFSENEITSLAALPQVQDVGTLIPAKFPAIVSIGGAMGFSTLVPLEAAPDHMIDVVVNQWEWKEGTKEVPIILSAELLRQYNYVLAPSQGLPVLTEDAIKALTFRLEIGTEHETFLARIVGLSDRINSVLVPESFIVYGNAQYGIDETVRPTRLIIKTADPSDPSFVQHLKQHNYEVNNEQLRWNKLRVVVQYISVAIGLFAATLIGISVMVFLLFIELTKARSREDISLLLQLGYSPLYIRRFIVRRFIPWLLSAVCAAVIVTIIAQACFHFLMQRQDVHLSLLPGWPVWLLTLVCFFVVGGMVQRTIRKV